jgi:hypothetical protein
MKHVLSNKLLVPLVIFLITCLIYFITSPGESHYNYFARLAAGFTEGKLYIEENPPWLNELVKVGNKYYVVYPPMPAILMMPLALVLGNEAPQTLFSIFLGGINAVLVFFLILKLKLSKKTAFIVTAFFAFGTNHWYLSSVGSSWFIAHVIALFFLLLALIETFSKQRLFLIGLLVGASFWARTPVIFAIFFFWVYFWKKFYPLNIKNFKNFIFLNLGVFIFVFLDAYYNYLRFSNFSPLAPYNLIPGLENDPIFKDGFMSVRFIPRHLEALFTKLPEIKNTFPYLIPSLLSTPIWLTSPLLFYIFKSPFKNLLTKASWVGVVAPFSIIILWAGVGYAQFGYRFIQDIMPFLLILISLGIGKKPSKIVYILLLLSILVNAWGIILINKFDLGVI